MGDGPTATDWRRLGDRVRERRTHLRLPVDLVHHGGPTEMTVRRIEQGTAASIRPKTKTRLEHALQWPEHHVDAILNGTESRANTEPPVIKSHASAEQPFSERLMSRNGAIWHDHIMGATQEQIGEKYGIDQSQVSRILTAIRDAIPAEDKDQRRLRYAEQLDWMSMELAKLAASDPIPAYSNGRPILMADGQTMAEDHSHRVAAMRELRATQERASKMLGLEAAAKVQNAHTFEVTPELQERLDAARAALADEA